MFNPNISLGPWFWEPADYLIENLPAPCHSSFGLETLKPSKLAWYPYFLWHPEEHLPKIRGAYRHLQVDQSTLRQQLCGAREMVLNPVQSLESLEFAIRLFSLCQICYGMLLTVALSLNSWLRAADPDDTNLLHQLALFQQEVVNLAKQASNYRPIGASHITMSLISAWATTDELSRHEEITMLLTEYQQDFSGAEWKDVARWLMNRFAVGRANIEAVKRAHDRRFIIDDPKGLGGRRSLQNGMCCIL